MVVDGEDADHLATLAAWRSPGNGADRRYQRRAHPRRGVRTPRRSGGLDRQVEQNGGDAAADHVLTRQSELEEDRADVLLHGALGQYKVSGDRGVALAGRHGGQHLALARGQRRQRRVALALLAVEQHPHHRRVDHRPAAGDHLDRGVQLAAVGHAVLQQVGAAFSAVGEQLDAVARLGVVAEDDDADPRIRLAQRPRNANALVVARGRHAHVGDDDIGLGATDRFEQRRAVGAVGDDLEVVQMHHNLVHSLAHQERVVGQGDADRAGGCRRAQDWPKLQRR